MKMLRLMVVGALLAMCHVCAASMPDTDHARVYQPPSAVLSSAYAGAALHLTTAPAASQALPPIDATTASPEVTAATIAAYDHHTDDVDEGAHAEDEAAADVLHYRSCGLKKRTMT